MIANIQYPSYVLVAAKAATGITDLSQIRQKRWPVRILTAGIGGDFTRILAHFGISRQAIEAVGGRIGSAPADRENFDVAIGGGGMTTATAIYGRADMPDGFAYTVARAMDEQQQLLQWRHLNFSYNVHTVWNGYEVPLHPPLPVTTKRSAI